MKLLKYAGIAAVVVIALSALGVGYVFAQKAVPTPWAPGGMMQGYNSNNGTSQNIPQWMQDMHQRMTQNGGTGQGATGGMMGSGIDMNAMHQLMSQNGGMHEQVWAALAQKLGLTPDELTAQLKNGKTLEQLGKDKGVSVKDLASVMETAMEDGLKKAVDAGTLTQAQADQMTQAMDGRYEWMVQNMGSMFQMMGSGTGGCHGTQNDPVQGTSL